MKQRQIVVVTGMSGSGRSAALKAFEDIGFYCVDNLPLSLLPAFIEFAHSSDEARWSAIGIDIREKGFAAEFPERYGAAIVALALDILHRRPVPPAVFAKHQLVTPETVNHQRRRPTMSYDRLPV